MTHSLSRFRLRDLPFSTRVTIACFAAIIGLGYLVALSHMYLTYERFDGQPGVSDQDVRLHLLGDRSATLMEKKITVGSMAQYIPDQGERSAVIGWIHAGAKKEEFARIEPILKSRCISCHNHNGSASFRPLTNFEEVAAVATPDMGESVQSWARIAHEHIPPLSMMFLLLGLLFSFTAFPSKLKAVVVVAPFFALLLDFGSRGLARFFSVLVYGVMAGGVIMAAATVVMAVALLYETMIAPMRPPPAEVAPAGETGALAGSPASA